MNKYVLKINQNISNVKQRFEQIFSSEKRNYGIDMCVTCTLDVQLKYFQQQTEYYDEQEFCLLQHKSKCENDNKTFQEQEKLALIESINRLVISVPERTVL